MTDENIEMATICDSVQSQMDNFFSMKFMTLLTIFLVYQFVASGVKDPI